MARLGLLECAESRRRHSAQRKKPWCTCKSGCLGCMFCGVSNLCCVGFHQCDSLCTRPDSIRVTASRLQSHGENVPEPSFFQDVYERLLCAATRGKKDAVVVPKRLSLLLFCSVLCGSQSNVFFGVHARLESCSVRLIAVFVVLCDCTSWKHIGWLLQFQPTLRLVAPNRLASRPQ